MRSSWKNLLVGTAAALLAGAGSAAVLAGEEDEDVGPTPEQVALAKSALEKAVTRGKQLWNSTEGVKKSCAKCHEDPEKPKLDLTKRAFAYPAYSRRKKAVVTLQQKINEMIQFNGRGPLLDANGTDIAALEAYVVSLKAK